jgi:lipid II isoglutaminyl synthase (glutamine-hydrolysing)
MNRLIIIIIVAFGRVLSRLSRLLGQGSGTSIPGLAIELYAPWLVKYLAKGYTEVIMISGTNGKTTTRALINKIYTDNGVSFISNIGGANIYRGIVTALMQNRTNLGNLRSSIAILEVEEATLPKLTKYLYPTKLILTNIFRDQLDAYGEIEHTLAYFKTTLEQTSPQLIINQDDYKLTNYLSEYLNNATGFSIEKPYQPTFESSEKTNLNLQKSFIAKSIKEGFTSSFVTNIQDKSFSITSPLPGVFNIYNILAALAVCEDTFDPSQIIKSIESFKNVFGRGETITVDNSQTTLLLVKNPAGFNEVLKYLVSLDQKKINLAVCINDNIADGKDVSWLWDVPLENYLEKLNLGELNTSGTRGLDMLLRLEYAGANVSLNNNQTIENLIKNITKSTGTTYTLCTYTALLEVRKELGKYTSVSDINSEGN